jgi:hypothetical protein
MLLAKTFIFIKKRPFSFPRVKELVLYLITLRGFGRLIFKKRLDKVERNRRFLAKKFKTKSLLFKYQRRLKGSY